MSTGYLHESRMSLSVSLRMKKKNPVTVGSTNVFADLGYRNPVEALAKAQLASRIADTLKARALTHSGGGRGALGRGSAEGLGASARATAGVLLRAAAAIPDGSGMRYQYRCETSIQITPFETW